MNSSVLIFAGGGRYGKSTLRRICILTVLAKVMGKRVEFRSIGIYPYEWSEIPIIMDYPKPFDILTKVLMRLASKLADRVSIRDDFSRRALLLTGLDRSAEFEEDLTFKLKPVNHERSLQILRSHRVNVGNRPLVGVNVRTSLSSIRQRVIKVMVNILDWLIL